MRDATSIVSERLVYEKLSRFRPIRIHLGTRKLNIQRKNLLAVIWSGGLDTNCSTCGNTFDKERGPPVRTISLENAASHPKDLTKSSAIYRPIRIHNRHLQCIKNQHIDFVPVSHVWHDAVALAHASKQTNDEATALVYQIPLRTLLGVATKYGQTVEIWHDYISIPQWQHEVQQQLLLLLPAIFAANQKSLVHLDDRSTADLLGLNDIILEPSQMLAKYVHFRGARWFERMWVVLERASSKKLVTLSRDFSLLDLSLDELWDLAGDLDIRAYAELGHELYNAKIMATQHRYQIPIRNIYEYEYSFGTALDTISARDCREYRDRFVAICGFFPEWIYESVAQDLPDDAVHACLWVASKCLENGDYTPILLTNDNERIVSGASWLTCHERMNNLSWYWGATLSPAANRPTIDAGKIKIQVQPVGTIEKVLAYQLNRDEISAFDFFIRQILKVTGTCASRFISCVGRVYTVDAFVQNPPKSIDGKITMNLGTVSTKLELYVTQNGEEGEEADRGEEITKEIFDMLNLSAKFSGGDGSYSRFAWIINDLPGDCLTHVRCKSCQNLSIFRLHLWKEPPSGTQLYRIPGLQFRVSLADGVGIAVYGHRIIGIMMTGAPTCDCNGSEMVVIE